VADRFYCPDPVVEGRVTLAGDEAHHLARVRRIGPGEAVEIFDGRGNTFRAEVRSITRDGVELAVQGEPLPERRPPCYLTLATAVPKGDRIDWLVEKATELGVARLVPLLTARSVVAPREAKLERLRRLVVEAAKQCGWSRLMTVEEPVLWDDYLRTEAAPARLLAHPGGEPSGSWPRIAPGASAAIAIGPEGGFTDDEVEAARSAGWRTIGLGRSLLRIETAGLAASAALLLREETPFDHDREDHVH
jgi:16S rRNA (uracil1498-N3)-methyltransferase